MKRESRTSLLFALLLASSSLLACKESGFSGSKAPQKKSNAVDAARNSNNVTGQETGERTATEVGGGGNGSSTDTSDASDASNASNTSNPSNTNGNGSDSTNRGETGTGGTLPKCSTLQKFTFKGILINSSNYKNRGSTEGQCNTSCHWAPQPPDLKTRTGCSTRDCRVPGTTDDSLCPSCDYYKEACEA